MKCREAQRISSDGSTRALSGRVQGHVDQCSKCQTFFARQRSMQAYFEIGRREGPSPCFENRLLNAVHEAARQNVQSSPAARRVIFWPERRISIWRLAAAAALIVAMGGWVHLWDPNEWIALSTSVGPAQVADPLSVDFQHLLSAIAVPDPSHSQAMADSYFSGVSYRALPVALRFNGLEP